MTAERLPTIRPTREEYIKLAEVVEGDIGTDRLAQLMATVIPPEVMLKLIRHEDPGYDIAKDDVVKLVRGLANLHEGDRAADIAWAISVAERTFATEARAVEFINFATQRIQEFEADEAADVVKEPIDILKIMGQHKNPVDYSRMIMEDRLDFANIEGSGIRMGHNLPRSWWKDKINEAGDLARIHTAWTIDFINFFGGHFDWMAEGGQTFKTRENIGNGYMGATPPRGATMYFWIVSNDGKFRTDIVESKTKWS